MKIFLSSFSIALVLHLIVLGLFLKAKGRESAVQASGKTMNTIDLQFGTPGRGTKNLVRTEKAIAPQTKQISLTTEGSTDNSGRDSHGQNNGPAGQELSGFGFEKSIVSFTAPSYPRAAQKRGLEGNVRLKITVSADGTPTETHILQSSGHDILDRAALEAASSWRFIKKDSSYNVEKNVLFKLNN